MTNRDIGDFSTDPDGARDGKELVATIRATIQALWGFHAGVLQDVVGTNSIAANVEVTQGFTALSHGMWAILKPENTNTGAVEINVQGLGLKAIKTATGQALSAGDLVADTRTIIVFDSDEDFWWLFGSSGTTEVTVTGGIQVKRSEPSRLQVEAGPTTIATVIASRSFQCTYSNSRVIIEGAVSRFTGAGTADPDGVEIQLWKDEALIETITDAAIENTQTVTPFYFSHLPGDTDSHTYEVKVACSIAATYPVSSNFMHLTEMTPN